MFSNFKDAFKDNPQYSEKPPQVVIDAISSDLPDNLFYVYDHDGFCRLDASNGLQIQSGTIELSQNAQKALPESPTFDEIMRYAYNSQTIIKLQPNKDGKITINGNKIDIRDMVKAPLKNVQLKSAELWMQPIKFPEPFKLTIGNNEHELEMLITRVPNNSLYTQEYTSINNSMLSINYKLDMHKEPTKFSFNISFNIENAKTASDIVVAYEIFNSFLDGEGLMSGSKLNTSQKQPNKKISQDTISFWKKVSKLESLLDTSFNVKKEITVNDAKTIEALYCSLIENKPFKTHCNYNSVKGSGSLEPIANIEQGQEIYLEFQTKEHIDIFDKKIQLYLLQGIFGATIIPPNMETITDTKEYEVKLENVKGKKMYCSSQYFLNQELLMKTRDNSDHIEAFRLANELHTLE